MNKTIRLLFICMWLCATTTLFAATTYTVTQTTDDGTGATSGSLSWAINSVVNGDVINFNLSSGDVVTLSAALPNITHSLTMEGINAATGNRVTIQVATPGVSTFRVFNITAAVTLNDLILRGGNVTGGGGVISMGVNGTLNRCVIRDGKTSGIGGGISGSCVINQCTVTNNTALNGGGLAPTAFSNSTIIKNSTFTDNVATDDGGGIYMGNRSNCYIINTTISGNTAPDNSGGGIMGVGNNSSSYAFFYAY